MGFISMIFHGDIKGLFIELRYDKVFVCSQHFKFEAFNSSKARVNQQNQPNPNTGNNGDHGIYQESNGHPMGKTQFP